MEDVTIKSEKSGMIYATDQNHDSFPDPKNCKPVDEKGNFLESKPVPEHLIISHYWSKQRKKIGILVAISSLILMSILIQETDLFNIFFGNLFNLLWDLLMSAINYVLGAVL